MGYYIFIMNLKIYIMDCNNIPLEVLLSSPYISMLEQSSFDKYKNELTKKEKVASSILKNKYVGKYYLNEYGKPLSDNCYFNVSHSHGYVALVVDTVPVGLDIELIREVDKDLISYSTSEEEKEYVHDNVSFFEIWTNKEALVKANGKGIKQKIDQIIGLPINGTRTFEGLTYFNVTSRYHDIILTVSRQDNINFTFNVIKEVI